MDTGNKVRYSSSFCRNTGQYTGATPLAKGVVLAFEPLGNARLVIVKWANDYCGELPTKILEANLEVIPKRR